MNKIFHIKLLLYLGFKFERKVSVEVVHSMLNELMLFDIVLSAWSAIGVLLIDESRLSGSSTFGGGLLVTISTICVTTHLVSLMTAT